MIQIKKENKKNRINVNTTINKELYKQLRFLSLDFALNRHIYDLIEVGCQFVIENAATILRDDKGNIQKPTKSDRQNVSTLIEEDIYQRIRVLAVGLDLNANDLIEEGIRYVIEKYKDQMPVF